MKLTVVGLYTAGTPAAAYWWGDNYFPFGSGSPQVPMLDDLFSTSSTLARADRSSTIATMLQLPFLPGSLSVGEVGDSKQRWPGSMPRHGNTGA